MQIRLEEMSPSDWDRVCEIYLDGIATGNLNV